MAALQLSRKQWPFAPQAVNNCLLWLDAADQSSYTPGASISTWRNKGYSGGSATTTSGTIGSTTADINGLPAFSFAANTYMTMSSMTFTQTTRTVFVVVNIGASGTVRRFMCSTGSNTIDSYILTTGTDLEFNYNGNYNYITAAPYPIFNTTSIMCGTTLSTNGGLFVNGLAQTPYSTNTPAAFGTGATTSQTIGYSTTGTFVLGEAMIFDGAITDIQRQQVEGYLAQKWGLQSFLPSTHPYFTLNNLLTPAFAPTEIPTCALWLDASDATSVVGTGVATWKDKSGNGNNATGVNAPVFVKSTGGVSFTAASVQYFTMSVPYSKTNTMFMVASPVPSTTSNMYYMNTSAGNAGSMFLGGYNSSYVCAFLPEDTPNEPVFSAGLPTSPFIVCLTKTTGVTYTGYYNGTQVFTGTENTTDTASTWAWLGGAGVIGGTFYNALTATIYELIIYNVALTANQIQAVNAYLGAKWGVAEAGQGSIAPVANPTAISGCQLWLDGADQTSIVPIVSTWRDKSGEGNNLSLTAGTVTYVSNPGPPCVNFASGGIMTSALSTTVTASQSYVFVVCQFTSVPAVLGYVFVCPNILSNDFSIRFNTTTSLAQSNSNDLGYGTAYYINGILGVQSGGYITVPTGYNIITGLFSQSGTTTFSLSTSFAGRYFVGNIREVIVYTGPLTTTQRLQVENYLLAKWGAGRNFWIDASDATTVTTATNVVTWLDKSGNAKHATVVTGNPTLTKNALNGLSVLTFGGSAYMTSPLSMSTTGPLTYFCVAKPAAAGFIAVSAINGGGANNRPNTLMMYDAGSTPNYWWFSGGTGAVDGNTVTLATSTSRYDINANYWSPNYTQMNINGVSYTSSANAPASLASGGTFLVASASGLYEFWNGTIAEIIVYNTTLTTTQRQQVETYLANKWALTVATSVSGITNPTLIPGCVLWLDAADPTAVLTGVSQMNDKSGNGYNITQATATYQPSLSNNYLTLGTSYNSYMNMPQAAINNTTPWTLFLVFNPISTNNWIMAKQFDGNNTYNILSMGYSQYNTAGTAGVVYYKSYNAGTLFTGPAALTTSTNQLLTMIYNGTNIYYYINGVLAAITNGTFTIQSQTGATNATIGEFIVAGSPANSGVTNFQLGELDFYNSALTTAQTQQIEASLMNKWAITNTVQTANGSLVDTPFLPTDIAGCAAWYDGADTSSITMTGTAVTSWADKSGNSKTATAFNSPTYSISGLGVTMNGTNNYFTTTVTVPTSTHCLIAVHNPTTVTGNGVGNDSLFRFQQTSTYIVFPYMNGTTPRGYINSQDGTTTGAGTSVLVENAVAGKFNIVAANIAATSQNIYKNGVLQSTGAGSLTNVTSDVMGIGSYVQLYEWYQGTIYEMIVYNTTLTTAQLQSVTNYLKNKWGVAQTLTTIPTPVYNRPFQPVDITGCLLWLDAYDLTTLFQNTAGTTAVTAAGQQVQYWADKSGNANNATSSETAMTYNTSGIGYPSIYFSGSQTNGLRTNVVVTDSTYFYVVYMTQTSGVYVFSGHQGTTHLKQNYSGGSLLAMDYSGIGGLTGTVGMNTNTIVTRQDTSSTGVLAGWQNGASIGSKAMGVTGETFTQLSLGVDYPSGFTGILYMSEVIIYNSVLSTGQRQQVEAYLAWKYGLISSLTSGHPGRTLPSFSTIFTPKSISSLTLWLDGADPAGTGIAPANASSITAWVDKSGLGYSATGGVSPTFATNSLNGLGTITFNGTSQYLYASTFTVPTATHFMIAVHKPNSIGTAGTSGCDTGILRAQSSGASGGYIVFPYSSYGYFSSFNGAVILNNYDTAGAWNIYGVNVASGNTVQYQNGSLSSSTSASVTATTSDAFTIGSYSAYGATPQQYYSGSMAEIIVCSNTVTTFQRQQIEGYLAWKWGVQSSLPTTHPFKKFAP